ncbi:VOC family protein [Nesterenkonia sp. NBAIMH1]|uniref:VOC family protein n=1 Tax=Nesterenkonia sp. NBAIMH1 TaxID=2600320 RepID=UPI001FF07841|nr:VOC family protein [Nesterenkonia sp. NBAIMH1]
MLDAANVTAEAQFWADILGGEAAGDHEWQSVRLPDGTKPVAVQLSPEHRPSHWPDEPVNSHMDLWVESITTAHQEALELGAELLQSGTNTLRGSFSVYSSPAGHPFCLCWDA